MDAESHSGVPAAVSRDGAVAALIAGTAAVAGVVLGAAAAGAGRAVADRPVAFAGLLVAACVLQLSVVKVPEQGAVSFAGIAVLASAFYLGAGAGMIVAAAAALVRFASSRGRLDRAIFDAVDLALAAAAAEATFHLAAALDQQRNDRFGPSVFAAAVFYLVNTGLLSVAMGLSEGERPFQVWKRRFRWLAPWTLASGPYAELTVVLYQRIGVVGVAATALMPFVLMTPIRRRMYWSGDDGS